MLAQMVVKETPSLSVHALLKIPLLQFNMSMIIKIGSQNQISDTYLKILTKLKITLL